MSAYRVRSRCQRIWTQLSYRSSTNLPAPDSLWWLPRPVKTNSECHRNNLNSHRSVHLYGSGGSVMSYHNSTIRSGSQLPLLHIRSSTKRSIHTAHSGRLQLLSSKRGKFTSLEDAREFVASLPSPQRMRLEEVIVENMEGKSVGGEEGDKVASPPPTRRQLKLLCMQHMLPFIGFGFLDNFIMITVGEYIDVTVGAALSISTMAAAGIGNLISDLAGLGLADQVEALCRLLGIPNPKLSLAQLQYRSARLMGLLGRCFGIIIGCTIGMAPLLWFNSNKHNRESSSQGNQ